MNPVFQWDHTHDPTTWLIYGAALRELIHIHRPQVIQQIRHPHQGALISQLALLPPFKLFPDMAVKSRFSITRGRLWIMWPWVITRLSLAIRCQNPLLLSLWLLESFTIHGMTYLRNLWISSSEKSNCWIGCGTILIRNDGIPLPRCFSRELSTGIV